MANLSCVWDTMLTQGEAVRAVQKAATGEAEEAGESEEAVGMMLGLNLLGKLEEPRIYVCCELGQKTCGDSLSSTCPAMCSFRTAAGPAPTFAKTACKCVLTAPSFVSLWFEPGEVGKQERDQGVGRGVQESVGKEVGAGRSPGLRAFQRFYSLMLTRCPGLPTIRASEECSWRLTNKVTRRVFTMCTYKAAA